MRPPPVGDHSYSAGVQGPSPRDGPRRTGESPAAPRLALPGQPPQLQLFRPRPSEEGLRTEVRGGAARYPPGPARASGSSLCSRRCCLATEPRGPSSSGAPWVPSSALTGWPTGSSFRSSGGPKNSGGNPGRAAEASAPRRTRLEARRVWPPGAARPGRSSRREASARLETPAPAARLQARDLDSNIGRRSRALTPEMNI